MIAVGVVVLAAALLVAFLFVSGAFTPGTSTSPGTSYPTYRQALASGSSGAASVAGGPWSPIFASGIRLGSNATLPASNLTALASLTNCSVVWEGGFAPTLTLPATPASAGAGAAAFWTFAFVNSSGAAALVIVTGSVATPLATISGSECREVLLLLASLTSSTVVDSPVVAANASAVAAGWLLVHPDATETFEITPGVDDILTTPPVWHVALSTCSLNAPAGSVGADFYANLTAATGAVTAHGNGTGVCDDSSLAPALKILPVAAGTVAPVRKAI